MAARSDYYIEENEVGLGASGTDESFHTATAKGPLWQQGMTSVLSRLDRAHIPAVVVHPVPDLRVPLERHRGHQDLVPLEPRRPCPAAGWSAGCSGLWMRKTAPWPAQRLPGRWTSRTPSAAPSAAPRTQGKRFMYRDNTHLSVEGALALTGRFYAAITAHARPRTRNARTR